MDKKSALGVGGLLVFALVLLGAGCGNNSATVDVGNSNGGSATNSAPATQRYVWEGQTVTFSYPGDAFVVDAGTMPDGSFAQVFLSPTSVVTDPNSSEMDSIAINNGTTLERVMQYFTKTSLTGASNAQTEQIGERSFTKVSFMNSISGLTETRYFLTIDSDSFLTYSDSENDFDAKAVLSSLQL